MRISALSLIAAASITLTGFTAFADDAKSYPGAACSTNEGPTGRDMGRAWNVTASPQQLFCPVVKDARRISAASVTVVDTSNTQNFQCVLYSIDVAKADATRTGFWQTVESQGVGHQTLHFGSGYPEHNPGAYHLWCSIPAKAADGGESQLVAYRVTEQE
jgi:hypothetical protein